MSELPVERRFRPDIEGLRAVAVLLVVLYHAKLAGMTGGYVGVDVFFVISGFLITRQLFETQQLRGRVHLAEFYLRRIKRLLPAAVVVTLAVLAAARMWSSTLAAKDIAKDAIYTALYGMNFHLAAEGTEYLNASKTPSPLQHFWSLAVEEQFYVGLPLLILAVVVVAARYRRPVLIGLIASGAGYSLYLCVVTTVSSAPDAYFSIATRAWELGVGSLVALSAPWLTRMPEFLAAGASWVGLIWILSAGFAYTDATAFPGTAALLPVGGAALIVAGGCHRARGSAEVLLGRWVAQLLGKTSYSLYLWHWPVLVFAPVVVGHELNTSLRVQALFVSLLLAVTSYFHVELPGRRLPLRKPAWVLSGPALAGLTAAIALLFTSSLPALTGSGGAAETAVLATSDVAVVQRALATALHATAVPANLTPDLASAAKDYPQARDCIAQYDEVKLPSDCVFGDRFGTRTVALFGDSHAAHWISAFDAAARTEHWKVILRSKVACPVSDVSYLDEHFKRAYTECTEWRRAAVAEVVARKPDLVVASQADGTPGTKVTDAAWAAGTVRTLRSLGAGGSRLMLLSDVPQPAQPLECLSAHLDDVNKCVTSPAAGSQYWPDRRDTVAAAARQIGATVVNTDLWMCSGQRCPPIVGNMPVYRDSGHLTHTYSAWLAPVIRPLLAGSAGADELTTALPALERALTATTVPVNLTPSLARANHDLPASGDCHLDFLVTIQGPCLFGDLAGTRTVVLFGDSHVNQWFAAFDAAAKRRHWKLINWTKAACPVADLPVDAPILKRNYSECELWRRATVARIVALHPDLVIAGQSDATKTGVNEQQWANATAETLRQISRPGAPALLLEDNPYAPADPLACLSEHLDDTRACNYLRTEGYRDTGPNLHEVVATTVRRAGFRVIDTGDWTCGVDACPVIVGNMPVYRDRGHVTDTYAAWLTPVVESLLPDADEGER